MKARIIVVGAAAAATVALGTPAHAAATYTKCGDVSFTGGESLADSNYGARNVRALNVGCATAKSVARGVVNGHDHKYSSHGFACKGIVQGGGYTNYTCTKSTAKIKYTAVGAD